MNRTITHCPVCTASLGVTELTCPDCATRLCGNFPSPPLARLAPEHQAFVETFVLCRGIIRDVERVLGISYPTVRARLDAAVEALEAALATPDASEEDASAPDTERDARRRDVLRQVAEGGLSAADAAELLRQV